LACLSAVSAARGQETLTDFSPETVSRTLSTDPGSWTSPEHFGSTLQVVLTLTVISLAPAILLMTTSYVRIAVVLGLLRQALGIQQLPSNQVISSIALFMTLLIMSPVWKDVYDEAIAPYTDPDVAMSAEEAWEAGIRPVRRFMSRQIEIAENDDDVWLFFERLPADTPAPENFDDVPLQVLLPAFMLSELKVAFLIGFQVYLPFLILDLVVSSVTISMGMLMLPPMMISMPLKLMLFVLVDGWHLVVGMLLDSFAPYL
jgi:flagellar biosynthetic protein FliP